MEENDAVMGVESEVAVSPAQSLGPDVPLFVCSRAGLLPNQQCGAVVSGFTNGFECD